MISELESYEKMMKGRSLIKTIPGTGKGQYILNVSE